jgi:hypothetical protein
METRRKIAGISPINFSNPTLKLEGPFFNGILVGLNNWNAAVKIQEILE